MQVVIEERKRICDCNMRLATATKNCNCSQPASQPISQSASRNGQPTVTLSLTLALSFSVSHSQPLHFSHSSPSHTKLTFRKYLQAAVILGFLSASKLLEDKSIQNLSILILRCTRIYFADDSTSHQARRPASQSTNQPDSRPPDNQPASQM